MRRGMMLLAVAAMALLAACGSDGDKKTAQQSTATAAPAASAAATTAASATAAPATPITLQKVTIGYVSVLPWAPIFVAADKGYFKEQGIDPNLQGLSGGAEILTQTAAGNFDVGSGGSSALFNVLGRARSLNQKQAVTLVAPLHLEKAPLATPLVVSKKAYDEGRITKVGDLKGKKVAINAQGTATEYWLEKALAKGGMSVKDVEVVGIPFPSIAQALESGAIAGAVLTEPFTTLGVNAGTVKVLDNAFLDGDLATVVFYNAAWAEKNPRLAQGFMNAYLKAVRDLEGGGWSDPATLAILSKYTNTPVETIKAAARPYSDVDGNLNVSSLEAQQKFFKEQGRLTYDQLLDLSTVVNTTYAKEAVKLLGPAKR